MLSYTTRKHRDAMVERQFQLAQVREITDPRPPVKRSLNMSAHKIPNWKSSR